MDIKDLIQDNKNLNKGTARGNKMLMKSLQEFGVGRGILVDKNYRIIGGNKTVNACMLTGVHDIRIVDSDGKTLVAVKRTDIDLDSKEGRELAFADNAVSAVNLLWNDEVIDEIESIYGEVREEWGIEKIEHDSKGEIDLDDLEETQTLKIVLSPSDYDKAVSVLQGVNDDISFAFLKMIGYVE